MPFLEVGPPKICVQGVDPIQETVPPCYVLVRLPPSQELVKPPYQFWDEAQTGRATLIPHDGRAQQAARVILSRQQVRPNVWEGLDYTCSAAWPTTAA